MKNSSTGIATFLILSFATILISYVYASGFIGHDLILAWTAVTACLRLTGLVKISKAKPSDIPKFSGSNLWFLILSPLCWSIAFSVNPASPLTVGLYIAGYVCFIAGSIVRLNKSI